MTEWSQPWDGVAAGDAAARAPYSATEWDDMWEDTFGSWGDCGMIRNVGGQLEVSGIASPVVVATGAALVKGKFFRNVSAKSLSVASPSGATRTDYIVLRSCWGATGICGYETYVGSGEICGPQKIRICHKQNPNEGTGVPPALVQTDGIVWEIPLAIIDITVGGVITVTDARNWVRQERHRTRILDPGSAVLSASHVSTAIAWTLQSCELRFADTGNGQAAWARDLDGWDETTSITVQFFLLNQIVGPPDGGNTRWRLYASQWISEHCEEPIYTAHEQMEQTVLGDPNWHTSILQFTLTYAQGFRRTRPLHLTLERRSSDPLDTSTDTWICTAGWVGYNL